MNLKHYDPKVKLYNPEQDQPNTSDEFFSVLALAVVGIGVTLLIGIGMVLWLI